MTPATARRRPGRDALRRNRSDRSDAGTTLVELLVSSIVLSVVLVVVGLAVASMIRTSAALEATAATQDDARAVTAAVTRSLASATLVNPPASVGAATYLEALVPAGAGAARCVQWRVTGSGGRVEARSWLSGTTTATPWSTVARGVVNADGTPPFAVLAADADWSHARVVVDLRLRRASGGPVTAGGVVPLVDGTGTQGGLATDPVCTEAGRS